MSGDRIAALLYAALLLMLVITAVTTRQMTARTMIRNALVWTAIFAAGVALAALWSTWQEPPLDEAPFPTYRSDLT